MLLVFHVRLTLLVNMGPRVHFVAALHDSSVQSGSVEICAVFLRRETKHLGPLSGEYLSGWHSSLVPNDIRITLLQNIYINKLLCPINSPPDCWAGQRLLPEHRVHSPSAFIVYVFAQTCNTQSRQTVCLFYECGICLFFFTIRLGASALWQQVDMSKKQEYSGSRERVWPMVALSGGRRGETTCCSTERWLSIFIVLQIKKP